MLIQQMGILCNILIVEIGNSNIEQYVKNEGKVKYRKIDSKVFSTNYVLDGTIDAKNIEGFNQQVKQQQKTKISKKFTLHTLNWMRTESRQLPILVTCKLENFKFAQIYIILNIN